MDYTWIKVCMCLSACLYDVLALSRRYFMEDECSEAIDMTKLGLAAVRLQLTKYSAYHSNMECVVRIIAPRDKRLMMQIFSMELANSNGCDSDYLEVFDGMELTGNVLPDLPFRVCDSTNMSPTHVTSGRNVTVRFRSNDRDADDGFRMNFVAFRGDFLSDTAVPCYKTEFRCAASGRCIADELQCDGHVDCGDASDECGLSSSVIIAIAVISVVVVCVIVSIVLSWRCYKDRRKARNVKNDEGSLKEDIYLIDSNIQCHRLASLRGSTPSPPVPDEPTYSHIATYSRQPLVHIRAYGWVSPLPDVYPRHPGDIGPKHNKTTHL